MCTLCVAGKHVDSARQCLDCAHGKYSDLNGEVACKECAPGQTFDSTGIGSACADCVAGKISGWGTSACEFCGEGKSTQAAGGVVCEDCPAGRYSGFTMPYSECYECAAGQTSEAGSSECDPIDEMRTLTD